MCTPHLEERFPSRIGRQGLTREDHTWDLREEPLEYDQELGCCPEYQCLGRGRHEDRRFGCRSGQ